jgi:hypothetical protein
VRHFAVNPGVDASCSTGGGSDGLSIDGSEGGSEGSSIGSTEEVHALALDEYPMCGEYGGGYAQGSSSTGVSVDMGVDMGGISPLVLGGGGFADLNDNFNADGFEGASMSTTRSSLEVLEMGCSSMPRTTRNSTQRRVGGGLKGAFGDETNEEHIEEVVGPQCSSAPRGGGRRGGGGSFWT